MTTTESSRTRGRDLVGAARRRLATLSAAGSDSPIANVRADIVLDGGCEDACTIVCWDGRVSAHPGRTLSPATRISGSVDTLLDVIASRTCGVDAFLAGHLEVEGNLALALQLDGLLNRERAADAHSAGAGAVRAAGVDTWYLEAGDPAGRPVILLHGLGSSNSSVLPLLWSCGPGYRTIAPDLPGHGASGAPRGRYDAAFFAEWLAAFLDQLDAPEAVLVGNSLGGRISLELALDQPERVTSLVLLAPAVALRRLRQFVPVVRLLRPELAALPLPMTAGLAQRGLQSLFAHPDRVPPQVLSAGAHEFVRVYRSAARRVAFYAALRNIYLDDPFGPSGFWSRLPELRPPSLWVWGSADRLVPLGFARHVTEALPAGRSVVLDECGHVPQFEQPDRVAALISEFLPR